MKVLIIGATGATGAMAVQQALDAGHEVVALARAPEKLAVTHARLTVVQGDATRAGDLARALPGVAAVVAILSPRRKDDAVRSQAARALVEEMKRAGVARLVWVSASGVGDSLAQAARSSFVFGRVIVPLFMKAQFADAAVAEEAVRESDLDWTVVRPVQLVNAPARNDVGASLDGEKLTRLQIPRADVAAFLVAQVTSDAYARRMPVIHG